MNNIKEEAEELYCKTELVDNVDNYDKNLIIDLMVTFAKNMCDAQITVCSDIACENGIEDDSVKNAPNICEIVEEEKEEEIDVLYSWIKYNCGWSRFCDVTGHNHYAINGFGDYDSNHRFTITLSQAKNIGYIK